MGPLVEECRHQSQVHPDACLRRFYSAWGGLLADEDILSQTLSSRADLSVRYLANLFYRVIQYFLIFEEGRVDFATFDEDQWSRELARLFTDPQSLRTLEQLLREKNTQSTIYQRYAGPKAFLSALFGSRPLAILDVGCGMNVGLPGLCLGEDFLGIEDHTPNRYFSRFLEAPLTIERGYGCDLEDPRPNKEWALACGFYPGELGNLPAFSRFVDRAWSCPDVVFIQGGLLDLSQIWRETRIQPVDAVVASTVLYQFSDQDREEALANIRAVLKDGGCLIINDFVRVGEEIEWDVPWFREGGRSNYRTVVLQATPGGFSRPREFVEWNNGRCRVAYPGRDFTLLCQGHLE